MNFENISHFEPRGALRQSLFRVLVSSVFYNTLIRIFGLLAGLACARLLSLQDYASYMLILSVTASIENFIDAGPGVVLTRKMGSIGSNQKDAGRLLYTASIFKLRSLWIPGALAFAYLSFSMYKSNYRIEAIALSLFIALLSIIPLSQIRLFNIFCSGAGIAEPFNRLMAMMELFRFLLVLLVAWCFSELWMVLFIYTGLQFLSVRCLSTGLVNARIDTNSQVIDLKIWEEMRTVFRQLAHNKVYFMVHSQVVMGFLYIMGSGAAAAGLSVLSRVMFFLPVFSKVGKQTFVPRMASIKDEKAAVKYFYRISLLLTLVFLCISVLMPLLHFPLIMILGEKYDFIQPIDLLAMGVGASLSLIGRIMVDLTIARGWIWFQSRCSLLLYLGLTVFSYLIFDGSTLKGAIWITIIQALAVPLEALGNLWFKNKKYGVIV